MVFWYLTTKLTRTSLYEALWKKAMAKKYEKFYEGEIRTQTSYDYHVGLWSGGDFRIIEEGGPNKEQKTKAWVKVQRLIKGTHLEDGTLPYWTYKRFFGNEGRKEFPLELEIDAKDDQLL